ncbi:hypothetical protein [Mixta mediterraneensis]|uniref:hypothetical protein n=1 Tax=Mixta mediterraneensis TaxID=2758443 RepID=UPI0018740599|nr:hypothetical protein [Mixta mediterraneensis]MBE5251760.1 hypothetical protein [Mixta mediterraneensis]
MSKSTVLDGYEIKKPDLLKLERDGIYSNSAVDTARAAAEYASQLSHEYHSLLHRHLFMANPKVAGRFHSLITELTTMTDLTLHNVRFGRK